MSVDVSAETATAAAVPSSAADYLGLTFDDRYAVISQQFPAWLLAEPITFPRHHETYGWACRVAGCESIPRDTDPRLICHVHGQAYARVKSSIQFEQFLRDAKPRRVQSLGWALSRKPDCGICGSNREALALGFCTSHLSSLRKARQRGIKESDWRATQTAYPRFPSPCAVQGCVHDANLHPLVDVPSPDTMCQTHNTMWRRWLKESGRVADTRAFNEWLASATTRASVTPADCRGQLRLAHLPIRLQCEIRYGLHRHAKTAGRTQWRPTDLQKVVNALAEAGVNTLHDRLVAELARDANGGGAVRSVRAERRIWQDLPIAARSLSVNRDTAKLEGWFDPVIVGAAPFPGSAGDENRRKPWNLTAISQPWLRDLLWDHLHDEALKQGGRRPSGGIIATRIRAIIFLSQTLRQIRADHGDAPARLSANDANTAKELWDLWYREQIPILIDRAETGRTSVLTEITRSALVASMRIVLQHNKKSRSLGSGVDSLVLNLPTYPKPAKNPRPRPLSFSDFQRLVSEDSLRNLGAADKDNVGYSDIWLTHAFQGGRINETLKLRLGCVGLVGAAQPYIWRDISKVNLIDYGMPCHLPVYQRLVQRQEITRAKLRRRYADKLALLDVHGRAQLEAEWDRTKPLFPRTTSNPDLALEPCQTGFRRVFTGWLAGLGLSGITTHQTRATMATSLLNNGAPAELVRQLLGHFSDESLAHYARYNDATMIRHLRQVWAAGPGTDEPGTILLRPSDFTAGDHAAAAARIDLTVVPVEHGLCRYGPVVGGENCPFDKNCTNGPLGPCEHFVLTGADLAYWERKRDAAFHFAEGAPTEEDRYYILSQWQPWEPVLDGLRQALDELGLLDKAEKLDLRSPVQDYFGPCFRRGGRSHSSFRPPT